MAYTLTGARYIGTGSLPTPVLGYDAVDTSTGNLYAANSSATGWNLIGNVNYTNLGLLPLTGGTMTGNVAGPTGWAPNDSPNFTTTAKLGGLTLATQTDLANTSTSILNSIAPKITSAIASTSSSITVKNNVALGNGLLHFAAGTQTAQTIPLPQYSDGTTAVETECKWLVGFLGSFAVATPSTLNVLWVCGRYDPSGDQGLVFSADPTTTRTFWGSVKTSDGSFGGGTFSYLIIGIKS